MHPKALKTVHFNVCNVLIGKKSDQLKQISKPPPSASRPPLRRCGLIVYHWRFLYLSCSCGGLRHVEIPAARVGLAVIQTRRTRTETLSRACPRPDEVGRWKPVPLGSFLCSWRDTEPGRLPGSPARVGGSECLVRPRRC